MWNWDIIRQNWQRSVVFCAIACFLPAETSIKIRSCDATWVASRCAAVSCDSPTFLIGLEEDGRIMWERRNDGKRNKRRVRLWVCMEDEIRIWNYTIQDARDTSRNANLQNFLRWWFISFERVRKKYWLSVKLKIPKDINVNVTFSRLRNK